MARGRATPAAAAAAALLLVAGACSSPGSSAPPAASPAASPPAPAASTTAAPPGGGGGTAGSSVNAAATLPVPPAATVPVAPTATVVQPPPPPPVLPEAALWAVGPDGRTRFAVARGTGISAGVPGTESGATFVAAATDCDGRWSVQGFDAASGAYRWRADLPGRFAADQLSGAGGTVVVRVTGDANALAGLDVASGRVRWRADLGDVPVGAADLRADPVVVAQQPGIGATTRLRAFGRGDGTVRWDQTAVGERGVLGLVVAPEAVAALALNPADPPSVVGLDPASGGLRWEVPGAGLTAGAAAAGGVTTATRPAGGVVGIDLATGAVRWERPDLVDPFVPLGLAVASGDVVLAGLAATGAVQAVRLADGATGWPAGDGEAPGGAGPGGFALVGAGDGGQTVARVVRADGSALGTTSPLPPPDEVQPLVVGADGTAYVGRSCPGAG